MNQTTPPNPEDSQQPQEIETKKPDTIKAKIKNIWKKFINPIRLLIWNTFDIITDIAVSIQWISGLDATPDKMQICDNDSDYSTNLGLRIVGPILLLFSLIGFGCFVYEAYQSYILKKYDERSKLSWNWPKYSKYY